MDYLDGVLAKVVERLLAVAVEKRPPNTKYTSRDRYDACGTTARVLYERCRNINPEKMDEYTKKENWRKRPDYTTPTSYWMNNTLYKKFLAMVIRSDFTAAFIKMAFKDANDVSLLDVRGLSAINNNPFLCRRQN